MKPILECHPCWFIDLNQQVILQGQVLRERTRGSENKDDRKVDSGGLVQAGSQAKQVYEELQRLLYDFKGRNGTKLAEGLPCVPKGAYSYEYPEIPWRAAITYDFLNQPPTAERNHVI